MIIRPNFIFLHVPRTGGTSIEYALCIANGIQPPTDNTFRSDIVFGFNGTRYTQHMTAREMLQHGYIDANEFESKRFCVIRHPLERLVSMYKFLNLGVTFKKFVIGRLDELHFPRQQLEYFREATEVFRFEELHRFWLPLPHLNSTVADDYRSYYDDETLEVATRRLAIELKELGYGTP